MMMYWWIIEGLAWLSCLVINYFLIRAGKRTISQRYHALFDQKYDYVAMFISFGLQLLAYGKGWLPMTGLGDIAVCMVRNLVGGHWFWHED